MLLLKPNIFVSIFADWKSIHMLRENQLFDCDQKKLASKKIYKNVQKNCYLLDAIK